MISAIHTGLQRTENRSPTTYAPGKRIYNVWRIDRATYWTKRTVPRVLNDANTNTTIVYPPNVDFILFYLTVRRRSPVRRAAPVDSPFSRARVVRNTNSHTSGLICRTTTLIPQPGSQNRSAAGTLEEQKQRDAANDKVWGPLEHEPLTV